MDKVIAVALSLFICIFALRLIQNWPLSQPDKFEIDTFKTIRQDLSAKTAQFLPQPQAALLNGMLLGEQSAIPFDFKKSLQNTSTIHIIVVSGQNLTILAGFIMSLVTIFGRKKTTVLTILACIFYALLTGMQIPILRAAIMVLLVSIARLFNRDIESWWVLFLTGGAMIIFQPSWLLSISFQLSFLATLGVLVLAPRLIDLLSFLPEIVKQDLGVSLAAQILTWPIIAVNFHQLSLSGILVNALVLWVVSFVMMTGAAALLLSFISGFLASLIFLIPGALLTYFVYIVSFFDRLWGVILTPVLPSFFWAGYYLLLLGGFIFLKQRHNKKIALEQS